MRCGDWLLELKAVLPHGAWLPWLRDHCNGISERTAQGYMKLAGNRTFIEANPQRVADLSIRGAMRSIRTRSDELGRAGGPRAQSADNGDSPAGDHRLEALTAAWNAASSETKASFISTIRSELEERFPSIFAAGSGCSRKSPTIVEHEGLAPVAVVPTREAKRSTRRHAALLESVDADTDADLAAGLATMRNIRRTPVHGGS
jgi:hypothetical protein